jgi:hypothetical protein
VLPSNGKEIQVFLGAMMHWCFRSGVEVILRNKAYNYPLMNPLQDVHAVGEFHERDRDGSLVDMAHRRRHAVIEIPELIFSRGERHVSIFAHDWDDLMRAFNYRHKQIFMELNVPFFEWDGK